MAHRPARHKQECVISSLMHYAITQYSVMTRELLLKHNAPMSDHITNGIINTCLVKVEVQLTKLQVIIASVLNFSLPAGDIISLTVLKDASLNKWYHVALRPLDESWLHTFVTFFKTKHSLLDRLWSTN